MGFSFKSWNVAGGHRSKTMGKTAGGQGNIFCTKTWTFCNFLPSVSWSVCRSQFGHTAPPCLLPKHKWYQSPLQDVQWTPQVNIDIVWMDEWMCSTVDDHYCWCSIENAVMSEKPVSRVLCLTCAFVFLGPALWRIAPQRAVPFTGA